MKVVIVYSGKGGVGKTTTTRNVALSLIEKGNRVFILDGDINTPSMSVLFPERNPNPNLMVASTGYTYKGMIFLENSLVRKYLSQCINEIQEFNPDYVLVDTPPSITDVHINLLEKLKVSGVLIVTQPTDLSKADVKRTGVFFSNRGVPILGIVENMIYPNSPQEDYVWETLAKIPLADDFSGEKAYQANKESYSIIANKLENLDAVILENEKRFMFDESVSFDDIMEDFKQQGAWGLKRAKNSKFINLGTWENVRSQLIRDQGELAVDRLLDESTFERVERLVKAFEGDTQAYFMVMNAPNTEIPVFPGMIGRCSLVISPMHYGLPCVKFQTGKGEVTMFPHEVKPVDGVLLSECIEDGYVILPDGCYVPPRGVLEELDNSFGSRVGLLDGWEKNYDKLVGTVTKEEVKL